jgi:ubiquitin-like protein Pup
VPAQERPRPSKTDKRDDEDAEIVSTEAAEAKAALDDEVDSILDEIDDVLEENAEEFVRGFVQKGGQ